MKVWYAAYGSNMLTERFMLYIRGGVLEQTGRIHEGARDPKPPSRNVPIWLPGTVYFATESTTWPGTGRALYDPEASQTNNTKSAARAWLIENDQFLDLVAQEMRLPVGTFSEAQIPCIPGDSVQIGQGHYETLVCEGQMMATADEWYPIVTMAAPWHIKDVELCPLRGSYRELIIAGLQETMEWDRRMSQRYLNRLPGGREIPIGTVGN